MTSAQYHVRISKSLSQHETAHVWMVRYVHGRKPQLLKCTIKYQEYEESSLLPEASMSLPLCLLKELGHALVECGELPKDFISNDREMAATKSHLEDMRKLLFNELDVS